MKIDWNKYINQTLNVTMNENYGMIVDPKTENSFYEIVFKTGKLTNAFNDGLLLETERENQTVKIFIPFGSIKCVEIFDI